MKNRGGLLLIIITFTAIVSLLIIRWPDKTLENAKTGKLKVVATLFPLYDIAKNIGGNQAEISLLLPPGVEAHSFEPKPSDVVRINEADIFIYTSSLMEPWAADIIRGTTNKNLIVVDASAGIKMKPETSPDGDKSASSPDSHIWLDFNNTKIIAQNIKAALIAKDGQNAYFYEQAINNYFSALNQLDLKYRAALADCESREIIYGGHYAFGYLAKRYNLIYHAAQGLAPDSEPTASDLIALIEQIKKNNIKYVFYEELASPKIAETIAAETGAKLLLLNAGHNITKNQLESGISFFDIMNANLENLKIGLNCEVASN